MDVYRSYRCDFGHRWAVRRSEEEGEQPEDTLCPEGHEAVTCNIEEPVHFVQILMQPAGRLVDPVTHQAVEADQFRLVLLSRDGQEIKRSEKTYTWSELIKVARLFQGKTPEEATKWWDRRRP